MPTGSGIGSASRAVGSRQAPGRYPRYGPGPTVVVVADDGGTMTGAGRRLLVGASRSGYRRYTPLVIAVAVFSASFAAYAVGWFETSGGVVFLPADAAALGFVAASWIGFRRDGLVIAWSIASVALLGAHADHAFLGLPRLTLAEQLRYFLRPDGLAFLAVEGAIIGTLAFVLGTLVRWGVDTFASTRSRPPAG